MALLPVMLLGGGGGGGGGGGWGVGGGGCATACSLSTLALLKFGLLPTPTPQDVVQDGMWARGPWAGSLEDEAAVYQETGATLRCIPLQQPVSIWSGYSTCLYSGYQAAEVALFARAL